MEGTGVTKGTGPKLQFVEKLVLHDSHQSRNNVHVAVSDNNWYCRLCFRLRAALLYVGFHCLSLNVSAYMAIFKRVGFFIYLFSYA
jgi:hypothetical protein